MMLHEQPDNEYTCAATHKSLVHFLDSLKFQPTGSTPGESVPVKTIYRKGKTDQWKEHVTVYTTDSTIFLFNFITNMSAPEVEKFTRHLKHQDIP